MVNRLMPRFNVLSPSLWVGLAVTGLLGASLAACDSGNFSGTSQQAAKKKDAAKGEGADANGKNPNATSGSNPGDANGKTTSDGQGSASGSGDGIGGLGGSGSSGSEDVPAILLQGDNIFAAVDTMCDEGKDPPSTAHMDVAPPSSALPKTAPADCQRALEVNNLENKEFSIASTAAAGSRALTMEIDAATYSAPDSIKITATSAAGEKVVFNTCRLRTWDRADPTNGRERPPEVTIRSFRSKLPQGVTKLTFSFAKAFTPTYLKVVGLCDFDAANPVGVPASKVRASN